MNKVISDSIRKVFEKEEAGVTSWLQRHKSIAILALLTVVALFTSYRWPQRFDTVGRVLISGIVRWYHWLVFVWLAFLTAYVFATQKASRKKETEFRENFKRGLRAWDFSGSWTTDLEDGHHILIVADSANGGLAKACRLWSDYIFEFETRIVKSNSSWLIRASDIHNYVMLQCSQTEIIPHFRDRALWYPLAAVSLPVKLPLNNWFRVTITVKGNRVRVKAGLDGKEHALLDDSLLEPKIGSAKIAVGGTSHELDFAFSFPFGSVGFREYPGTECAHFRNVSVRKIV